MNCPPENKNANQNEIGSGLDLATKERDLNHFMRLSAAQVRYRLNTFAAEGYSQRVARLRLLEELIKEQIPDENPSHSACTAR
jgi:hypothetical protein